MKHIPVMLLVATLFMSCTPQPNSVPNTVPATAAPNALPKDIPAPTAMPTQIPTPTVTPTQIPTPTITPIPQIDTVPQEWRGKIDRVETLSDGRTVAVAKAKEPGQESLLRVLQLDAKGEWITYVPQIGTSYIYPGYDIKYQGTSWLKSLPIPELKQPMLDVNGKPIPLGYLGNINLGKDGLTYYWLSGIVGDVRVNEEQKLVEWALFLPSPIGDWHIQTMYFMNLPEQRNFMMTSLASRLDVEKLIHGYYTFPEFIRTTDGERILQKTVTKEMQFAKYLLDHNIVGSQVGIGVLNHVKVGNKDFSAEVMRLVDMTRGTQNVMDQVNFPPLNGWMIPKSMEGVITP